MKFQFWDWNPGKRKIAKSGYGIDSAEGHKMQILEQPQNPHTQRYLVKEGKEMYGNR